MYVARLLGPWLKHPFWRSAFEVDEEDARRIRASGIDAVVIDTSRGLDLDTEAPAAHPAGDAAAPARAPRPPAGDTSPVDFRDEIIRARRICEEGYSVVSGLFTQARLGEAVDPERALPLVEAINRSVLRNPAAMLSVARLKTADTYTYLHSVSTCALMTALARTLGLDEEQTREAGMGGLLHDLGKAVMPMDVLNKPGRLTDEEFTVIRQHPVAGERMLREAGVGNQAVLDIALHHHEKVDGSGYPDRLAGDAISLMARMGAVCDVYDAVTSDRPYKQGWDPAEALGRMVSWEGHFDMDVLKALIRSLGIYPVGALVRLASQRLAVVTAQTPGALLKPTVKAFYSLKSNTQIHVREIDLAAPGCQDRILGPESPSNWNFRNLEKLWMP